MIILDLSISISLLSFTNFGGTIIEVTRMLDLSFRSSRAGFSQLRSSTENVLAGCLDTCILLLETKVRRQV